MEKELFVPGRLCLFGEHSDWAGGHRRQNSEIGKGYAIVAPTNHGNYAKIKVIDEPIFRFKTVLANTIFEAPLKEENLLEIAQKGDTFSYIAGVAYEIVSNYSHCQKKGIEIDNYKTDLPVKKGLSSSASACVLTARAFNLLYDFGWTKKREMDIAYRGEIKTPSRCGRMDQACAYPNPIMMTFDGDDIEVEELKVGKDIPLLIVDLNRGKNTRKILAHLNKGFPFPIATEEKDKHDYLGPINRYVVKRAAAALEEGDSERLGALMNEAQEKFDRYLAPNCPDELSAPKLHELFSMKEILPLIYGGKGVGSGGDGTAQVVCRSVDDRIRLNSILQSLNYGCLDLDLKKNM